MKLTKWCIGALACTLFAACSDNDIANADPNNPGIEDPGQAVSGYIAVEIKLPQETGVTRAESYDGNDFNDGTANEYAVENAMILLFKGYTEDDPTTTEVEEVGERNAKFYRAQKLTKPFFTNQPEHDQITSSYLAAIEVVGDRTGRENFWAMVILNNNEKFTSVGSTTGDKFTVKIAGKEYPQGTKFSEILAATTTNSFIGEDGKSKFFMTNAPLSNGVYGGYNVTTEPGKENIQYLTDLGTEVYETPDKAKENVSGCIYVERAVAKVTYKDDKVADSAFQLKFYDESGKEIEDNSIKVTATVKYALTHTNNVSYVMRNVDFPETNHFKWSLSTKDDKEIKNYRMVGSDPMPGLKKPFHEDVETFYRTYWCLDPNYGEAMTDAQKHILDDTKEFKNLSEPLYCKENTFEVQYQNHANSTMAIFQVDYTITSKGKDEQGKEIDIKYDNLFIKDGDNTKIYLTKEAAAHNALVRVYNDTEILNALKLSIKSGVTTIEDGYDFSKNIYVDLKRRVEEGETTQTLWASEIKLVLKKNDPYFDAKSVEKFEALIGNPEGTKSYQEYDAEGKPLANADGTPKMHVPTVQKDLLAAVNALNDITEYTGGVSYYAIPIQHFGDRYTPWNTDIDRKKAGEAITGTSTSEVYNNNVGWETPSAEHAAKYLGRYGVVRNNWYELNISKIGSLGYASLPEIYLDNDYSDDNNEVKKYFAVEIHILSWAKRTQQTNF